MTTYYLTFTDSAGDTFTADGSPLYQIDNFNFSTSDKVSQSGVIPDSISFNPLSFTLGSSLLTQQLDQWLAAGAGLAEINLIGYNIGAGGQPIEVVNDVFKDVGLKSDKVDAADGTHSFTVEYGGLVESATPLSETGVQGTPVVNGVDAVGNKPDTSLSSGVGGDANVALPALNPATAVAAPGTTPETMYVRLLGAGGAEIGSGWIAVQSASLGLAQTLNLGANGVGAGQVAFDPLSLTFAPGALAPTLLEMEAAGTEIQQIDVAVYGGAGANPALTQDYRFSVAGIASQAASSAEPGAVTYTFQSGVEQVATYASGSAAPVVQGWDRVNNVADTDFGADSLPTTQAAVLAQLAATNTGEGPATQYYLTFTDSEGHTFNADGSPLYQIDDFNFSSLQTLQIGSQVSGGQVAFSPFSFTLGSSLLTQQLDQWLASGTGLAEINLIGYDDVQGGRPIKVVQDAFKAVGVTSDAIDAADGAHSFTVEYSGLVESATPLSGAGKQGTPVTNGWSLRDADTSLSAGIGGYLNVVLPTLNPATAVAPPPSSTASMYVRFLEADGTVLGSGWIALNSASFGTDHSLNEGSPSGLGGKLTFDPLTLNFAPGGQEPALLELESAGTEIAQIDIAVYGGSGDDPALTQDYRFGMAAISASDNTATDAGSVNYTFQYGSEQIATYANGSTTPDVQGWSSVTKSPDTSFGANVAPATQDAVLGQLANDSTGESAATAYYLTFIDSAGNTFTADGSPLYQIEHFNFSTQQTLEIGPQGSGSGTIQLSPLTFSLGDSLLTQQLDQWLASGAGLSEIDLYGYDDANSEAPVQVVSDQFQTVNLQSDSIDAADGTHALTVQYGEIVETTQAQNGTPATGGSLTTQDVETANAPASSTPASMYVQFLSASGAAVGSGWIALQSASLGLAQTPGSNGVTFNPLTLTFAPGTLEPTLLAMEAARTQIQQIDVAVYGGPGADPALTQDYRFGMATITASDKSTADAGTVKYTFQYGAEQIATYASGSATPDVEGWSLATNAPDTSFTAVAPSTQSGIASQLAPTSTGEGPATVPCFTGGVRLKTDRGEVAVEALQLGDRLLTLSGEHQPVVWIGRRRYVCGGHPDPEQVWPVVVAASAFEEGLPERDLVVSPGHALYVEGRLVQAIRLVNGATIRQAPVAEVDYWHVELPAHDVVYAEGLPTESYLDTGNRANFEGADMIAHPDFGPKTWDQTCVPYLDDNALAPLREGLLRRAEAFGFAFDEEPDLHALADGRKIPPVRLSENRYAFVFPEGVKQALLVSRTWRPREATPDNQDPRTLGVCIGRLDIDGSTLDLADERLAEGWSWNEPEAYQRWTTGRAALPPGLRIALLDVCGVGRYLRRARPFALEG